MDVSFLQFSFLKKLRPCAFETYTTREERKRGKRRRNRGEKNTLRSSFLSVALRCASFLSLSLSLFSLSPKGGVFKMQKEKLLGRRKQKRNENK